MKKYSLFPYFCVLLLLCSKKSVFKNIDDPRDIFEKSMEFYSKKEYNKAIEGFKKVIYSQDILDITDDAQFYLAQCYYQIKDYEQALMEFQFLADHFPKSEHSEESEFMMGKIKFLQTPSPELDQEETFNALKYMRDFIEKYPDSRFKREAEDIVKKCREKLAKKIFNNMVLYLKMGKLSSAQVYFQILKEEYSDLSLYDKAKEIIEDRK